MKPTISRSRTGFQNDLGRKLLELINQIDNERNDDFRDQFDLELKLLLKSNPELLSLVEPWLDRGDEPAQFAAIQFAMVDASPKSVELLLKFVKSRRGSDSVRYLTAVAMKKRNFIRAEEIEIFFEGKITTFVLPVLFVTEELAQQRNRPKRVLELANMALDHMNDNGFAEAEKLFRSAIEIAPDSPDLWNNLAMTFSCAASDIESVSDF